MRGDKKRPPKPKFVGVELDLRQKLVLESDRGCVLVAMAAIDEAIENLLRAFFRKVSTPRNHAEDIEFLLTKGPVPPLGNLAVRIRMCRAAALIDDRLYSILQKMVLTRNQFAHPSQPVELTDDDLPYGAHYSQANNEQMRIFLEEDRADAERSLPDSDAKSFTNARLHYMLQAQLVHARIIAAQMTLEDLGLPMPLSTGAKKRPKASPEPPEKRPT